MTVPRFSARLMFVLGGLIVWGAHFLLIYPFNAIACTRGFAAAAPPTILALTALALAALAALVYAAARNRGPLGARSGDPNQGLLRMLAIGIALLAGVAVVWETLPVLMIPPCA
jgi:hypothetical protein